VPLKPGESTRAPRIISELHSESKHGPSGKATALCSTNTAADPAPSALLPPLQTHKRILALPGINLFPKWQYCRARIGCSANSSHHSPCSSPAAPTYHVNAALICAQCLFQSLHRVFSTDGLWPICGGVCSDPYIAINLDFYRKLS